MSHLSQINSKPDELDTSPLGSPRRLLSTELFAPKVTVRSFLEQAVVGGFDSQVAQILNSVIQTCVLLGKQIARSSQDAALAAGVGSGNTTEGGDQAKLLDIEAHEMFVEAAQSLPLHYLLSEEAAGPTTIDVQAKWSLALDPLDGSNNIETNAPLGTIFCLLPTPPRNAKDDSATLATSIEPDLEPGSVGELAGRSVAAAGFVMYGPSLVLALSVGDGTHLFTYEPDAEEFVARRLNVRISCGANEFAINASNYRHWESGIQTYFDDLLSGSTGPSGQNFNMRWLAALVGEAYRILQKGGIFLYPADDRDGYRQGRLRLLYEAIPIAFLIEQAGGKAIGLEEAILDLSTRSLHQRTPLVFGSADKVDAFSHYMSAPEDRGERSPLFAQRGLFRS